MLVNEHEEVFAGNNLVLEHVRAELLNLLVKVHFYKKTKDVEKDLKNLVFLLDDIQFAFDVFRRQERLDLEPVNISEIRDQTLHKVIKDNNFNITLESRSRFVKPVLANRQSLSKSLEAMIYSAVDLGSINHQTISIDIFKRSEGVSVGAYKENFNINPTVLKKFRYNINKTTRPSSNLSPFSSTNLFIADTLLSAMGFKLKASIHNKQRGLSTVLPISKQLELV